VDLVEQINNQIRFALPRVDETSGIARTIIVLFSVGAHEAKARFQAFLATRFSDENAVCAASLTEGEQLISQLAERREKIKRYSTAWRLRHRQMEG